MTRQELNPARWLARRRFRRTKQLIIGLLLVGPGLLSLIAIWVWNRPLGPQLVWSEPAPTPERGDTTPGPNNHELFLTLTPIVPEITLQPRCGGPPVMYILLIGIDDAQGYSGFADAIRIVRVDFRTPSVILLSVPRDLWVRIPGLESQGIIENRLKAAYPYGIHYAIPGGGPSLLAQTLALNFGLRVDHYVVANFSAFVAGIDSIGGVDIYVTEPTNGPTYALSAGWHHMDGQTALEYARTRENNSSDLYRIDRQTQIILAVRGKIFSPEIIPALPDLISSMQDSMITDMSPSHVSALVCIGQEIEPEHIQIMRIGPEMVEQVTLLHGHEILHPDYGAIAQLVQAFHAGLTVKEVTPP